MGNVSAKQVGNFQARVGKAGASIDVVAATIFAVILIIIAIIMTIMALIPVKPWDCPDKVTSAQQEVNNVCTVVKLPNACNNARLVETNAKRYCSTKKRRLILLFGLLLIPIALLLVWGTHWWKREVHRSKTAAELGGTLLEYNYLKGLSGNNN